ncbi:translocation/assembly module TamB domain-containing protein [Fontimonas sp. SYSU GA230001]|uniref:translocation/assembly module TamB domain-containing protein n=1 Tax=Fontimonas sp. SYSU GA230001 TaxID=3142450 RepID=UPI0032B3EA3B
MRIPVLRIFGTLLAALRDVVGLALTLVVAALVFLLFTEAGARLALQEFGQRFGFVQAEGVHGRLWGPIAFERFRYEDAYVRVELERVRLEWSPLQALRANIAVSSLDADALVVTVKPQPETTGGQPVDDEGALTQLPVALDVRALAIGRFDLRVYDDAPLHFEAVTLSGSWIGDAVRLRHLAAVTPWVGAAQVEGDATLLPDGVRVAQLRARAPADAELEGYFGYAGGSDLRLRWRTLRWPLDGEPVAHSDGGTLHWTGRYDDWRYELALAVAAFGERFDVTAQGRGSLDELHAEAAHIDSGHGALDARLTFNWVEVPRLDVHGTIADLRPQHWLAALEGRVNGRVEVQAQFAGTAPDLRFGLTLDDSQLNGYPLRLDARGRYLAGRLSLQSIDLRSGPSRLTGSGEIWPRLAFDARLDSSELRSIWAPLSGRAQAQLRLDGDPSAPRSAGKLQAEALRYEASGIEALSAAFDVDPAGETRLDAHLRGIDAGVVVSQARLSLRGRAAAHRLSVDATLPQGQASTVFDGALDLPKRSWAGTLTSARLIAADWPPWLLEEAAALRVVGSDVTLEPACFASDLARACAALRPVDGRRRLAFRVERFLLAALDPWLPGGVRAQGRIDGSGYADIGAAGLADLRIDLHSSAVQLVRNGLPPLQLHPGQLVVQEEAQGLVARAELPFEQGGVFVDARLGPGADLMQRALAGELRATVPDLSWLRLLNPELERVQGRLDGRVELSGTPAAPALAGTLALADATLRLRTPGITLERVEATLSGTTDAPWSLSARAWSDGGVLSVEGRADPWTDDGGIDLRIAGERFQALRRPDAKVWVSPQLTLRLRGGELHADGVVEIPRAQITPKTIEQGVGPSADQVIIREGGEPGDAKRLGLFAEIQLRLGDDVRFDGLGLKSQLTGAVTVREAPGVPTRARGELQLLGGRYKAYGQDLSIETGRLLFTGGALTDPAVELRATRKPREDITVGVLVRGTLAQPEFSLFSTPAMPQERQLSWLVLGRALDEGSSTESDRALVADAALSLGFAGSEWLAQRLGKGLGVDEVTVGAKPGESNAQARLTIGKYLSPKLYLSYGVSLFLPGHSLRLQYDIGRGFKLSTETGTVSSGDLIYTIER